MPQDPLKSLVSLKDLQVTSTAADDLRNLRLRERLRELTHFRDRSFYPFGQILDEITRQEDPLKEPLYKQWGHRSLKEFCERELQITEQRAHALRDIYVMVGVDLDPYITPAVRRRFIDLGEPVLQVLTSVVTPDNWREWLEAAEKLPIRALKSQAKVYNQGGEMALTRHGQSYRKRHVVSLDDHADRIYKSALARVQKDTGISDKPGQVQQLALSYLAKGGVQDLSREDLLTLLEQRGYSVILVDAQKSPHEIVYGGEVLVDMAKSRQRG